MAQDKWVYKTIHITADEHVNSVDGRTLDKSLFLDVFLLAIGNDGWESSVSFTNPVTDVTTVIFKKKIEPSGVELA